MISATVAPVRRWRMSITWLSRRESADGLAGASSFLGISVAAMGNHRESKESRKGVEKSTVLNFQQTYGFVNTEVSGALSEHDVAIHCIDPDQRSAAPNLLAHTHIASRRPMARIPVVRFGDRERPVADDASLPAEIVRVGGLELEVRIQIIGYRDHHSPGSGCHIDRAGTAKIDSYAAGAGVSL